MGNEGSFGALGTDWEGVRVHCGKTWPSRGRQRMEAEDWRFVKLKRPNMGSLIRFEQSPLRGAFAKRCH